MESQLCPEISLGSVYLSAQEVASARGVLYYDVLQQLGTTQITQLQQAKGT